ncbi:hypothetical protein C8R28_100622 [Nitrosomonas ureae]|uniref:YgjP-like metallopeptidase domain-containing protein n=1 Tax=Nitrosomonas ureae TaxID=44577 RepID=A0A2T5ITQ4_9PROT|nr:hypothetical protein C8R28_100622 [Nitrosomonas ureae]
MLVHTVLNDRKISYTLRRCKRKSVGLTINHEGLKISVPLQASVSHIESILQQKADWITKKLEQWQSKKSLAISWTHDAIYPLLGEPWRILLKPTGEIAMAQSFDHEPPPLAIKLTPRQIEIVVMNWYQQQAIDCFQQRIGIYAQKLALPAPPFRLSQAKTRWGSCNSRGFITLNWRLIQLPLHLIDYVVTHELAHLIEMNHSKAFWAVVEKVCPGYRVARKALRGYG